jgi:hypothetical protein
MNAAPLSCPRRPEVCRDAMSSVSRYLLLCFAVACALPEADYSTRRGVVECRKLMRCADGLFAHTFKDMDACVDGIGDALDASIGGLPAGCEYHPDEGRRCLRRIRRMSCERFALLGSDVACDLVYTCPAGAAPGSTANTPSTTATGR